jgi:predicted NBD/HSP70 family sugar kinase
MSLTEHSTFRVGGPQPLTTSDDLRRSNAATVLRSVLVGGPLARAEIASRLGMTRATVTRVTGQLVEAGLLREGVPRRSAPGRPMVPLELAGSERLALSVHIGALELRVGLVNIRGEVVLEQRYPYAGRQPTEVAAVIARGVDDVIGLVPHNGSLLGISASVGGWVDVSGQLVVQYEPLGWKDVPLDSILPEIGLPRYFDQLVRGLALAENMYGVARGASDFLELWTGSVLGASLTEEGVVRRGPRGGAGGIDHFRTRLSGIACACGRDDCLFSVASDGALIDAAVSRGILRPGGSMRTLIDIVGDGDDQARDLLHERAEVAGEAAAVMADLLGPGLLVIAGLVTTAPGYQNAFERGFRNRAGQGAITPVVTSMFGDLAPTVASAAILLDAYFHDPLAFEKSLKG